MSVQIPFVDLRLLAPSYAHLTLSRPTWPIPVLNYEFVRRFGPVKRTPGGGFVPWPGEEYYCDASRVISFNQSPRRVLPYRPITLRRRLFTTGIIGRVQLDFSLPWNSDSLSVARSVASIKVRVLKTQQSSLSRCGGAVSRAYFNATRPVSTHTTDPHTGLVLPGPVLIYVERGTSAGEYVPVAMDDPDAGVLLEQQWAELHEHDCSVWTLTHGDDAPKDNIRRVRVHAMRLHSEYHAFAAVIRACSANRLDVTKSDRLRAYLHDTSKRLLRHMYDGLPQAPLLRAVSQWRGNAVEGEIESIEQAFNRLSPSLQRLINEARAIASDPGEESDRAPVYMNIFSERSTITVGDNNIEIGENAQVRGIVGRGNKISNSSFGDIQESEQQQLADLCRILITQLREGGAQPELGQMALEEVTSDQPQRGRLKALITSILATIKDAGQALAPAVETAGKILELTN